MPRRKPVFGGVPFYREYIQKQPKISTEEKTKQLKRRLLSRSVEKIQKKDYENLQLAVLASGGFLEDLVQ